MMGAPNHAAWREQQLGAMVRARREHRSQLIALRAWIFVGWCVGAGCGALAMVFLR